MMASNRTRVAILGSGRIGTDLLVKLNRSSKVQCVLVAGRDANNAGLRRARSLGCRTSDRGIAALVDEADSYDLVFDATDAHSHRGHWAQLDPLGKTVFDLTPSRLGVMVVPTVNGEVSLAARNISLISCGGQVCIPLVHAIARVVLMCAYVEVVTTAASRSVGRATRLNLDEYIDTTEAAICKFSGTNRVKAMVNLSPAAPPPTFRVAVSMLTDGFDRAAVEAAVASAAANVRQFCPGYQVVSMKTEGRSIFVAAEVTGRGDHLPEYAGNLDIINEAAVQLAEQFAGRGGMCRDKSN